MFNKTWYNIVCILTKGDQKQMGFSHNKDMLLPKKDYLLNKP